MSVVVDMGCQQPASLKYDLVISVGVFIVNRSCLVWVSSALLVISVAVEAADGNQISGIKVELKE